jgi:hypothetical protein
MYQSLTTSQQNAYVYWQMPDGDATVSASALTNEASGVNSPKCTAFKHYACYLRPPQRCAPGKHGERSQQPERE